MATKPSDGTPRIKLVAPVGKSGEPTARDGAGDPLRTDGIVRLKQAPVKPADQPRHRQRVATTLEPKPRGRPGRKKTRRRQHGSAWHWRQTDAWYYTPPGSKTRAPLFDNEGNRIRGKENREAAELALSRIRIAEPHGSDPGAPTPAVAWLVAKVCSEYIQYCERGVENGSLSLVHCRSARSMLNDLCKYCGALRVAELKKTHIKTWIDGHAGWKSPATHRIAIALVLAAFNYAQDNHDVPNPLKGLKRPAPRPRLQSLSADDERDLLDAAAEPFRGFLFAAIHTGLRPFCELAKLTAEHVEETPRGMMWRIYSSKTKKTRKIPIRPEVAALVRTLAESAPKGSGIPLFRNRDGNQWKIVTGVTRFIALRKKLSWDKDPVRKKYSCYTSRHTFAHRMLSGYWNNGVGCSVETLAELLGDTPKVAFDHYGKEWGQHFQDPLWNALGLKKAEANAPPVGS